MENSSREIMVRIIDVKYIDLLEKVISILASVRDATNLKQIRLYCT